LSHRSAQLQATDGRYLRGLAPAAGLAWLGARLPRGVVWSLADMLSTPSCCCAGGSVALDAWGWRAAPDAAGLLKWYDIWYYYLGGVMSITASEARKGLFPLIKKVNEDHDAIEIVSRHGNAVLVSAEDYAALREGAYLLRSPANARRLLKAYENALNGVHMSEHDLVDPDEADAR
jgi:antitoxin YefM